MPDAEQPLSLPAPDSQPPAPVSEAHVETIKVKGPRNRYIDVAANAVANRLHNQIIISKIRGLFEKELDEIEEKQKPLDMLTMTRLATTAATIQEMSLQAYEGKMPEKGMGADFERFAVATVQAAVGAATEGGRHRDRLAMMRELVGKRKEKKVTEVETVPAEVVP